MEPGLSPQTGKQPTWYAAWAPAVAWGQENRNIPLGSGQRSPWGQTNLPLGDETLTISSGTELCRLEPGTQLRGLPKAGDQGMPWERCQGAGFQLRAELPCLAQTGVFFLENKQKLLYQP